MNAKVAEYATLDADSKRAEKLCDVVDDRIKELSVVEDAGALNVSVLEVAKAQDKPSKPPKARILAMSLVLGLMVGVGLALLREGMDQRLSSLEEIAATLEVPVLGAIGHMGGRKTPSQRGQTVRIEPMSETAEAYRTLRTAVYFGVAAGGAGSILVTSPAPGDGKTTCAGNLAIAMAQSGRNVLIVDADFRRPMQHQVFEMPGAVGLSSVLRGQAKLENAIGHSCVERLDVLPCGPIPPNPAEMLSAQGFAAVLAELRDRYDHVVIDSPPVIPVADARILAAMCDVTILVLRAGQSTRKASLAARDGLLAVGAQILGTIVNDVSRWREHYGYHAGYGCYRPRAVQPTNGDGSAAHAGTVGEG